jgi:hypothetical protein
LRLEQKENIIKEAPCQPELPMPQNAAQNPQADAERLEAAPLVQSHSAALEIPLQAISAMPR